MNQILFLLEIFKSFFFTHIFMYPLTKIRLEFYDFDSSFNVSSLYLSIFMV